MYNVEEDVNQYKCYRCGGSYDMMWVKDAHQEDKYYPFCKECFDELRGRVTEHHVKKEDSLIIRGYMKNE